MPNSRYPKETRLLICLITAGVGIIALGIGVAAFHSGSNHDTEINTSKQANAVTISFIFIVTGIVMLLGSFVRCMYKHQFIPCKQRNATNNSLIHYEITDPGESASVIQMDLEGNSQEIIQMCSTSSLTSDLLSQCSTEESIPKECERTV